MKEEQNRVMGFGTFDVLHPGHLYFLKELKNLGDELIIVIARDRNVEKIKGRLPKFNEQERLQAVKKTGIPNEVVLGAERDFHQVIKTHKPNILGFGYDQRVDIKAIERDFPEIKHKKIHAFHPEKYKSSLLKKAEDFF